MIKTRETVLCIAAISAIAGCGQPRSVERSSGAPSLSTDGALPKLQPQIAPDFAITAAGINRYKHASNLDEASFPDQQRHLIRAIKKLDLDLQKHNSEQEMKECGENLVNETNLVLEALTSKAIRDSMSDINVASSARTLSKALSDFKAALVGKSADELHSCNLAVQHTILYFAVVLEYSNQIKDGQKI